MAVKAQLLCVFFGQAYIIRRVRVMTDRALFLLNRLVYGALRHLGLYLRMAAKAKLRLSLLPKLQGSDIAMRLMAPAAIFFPDRFVDLLFLQILLNLLLMTFGAATAAEPGLLSLGLKTG
jgi:hypothetical protein